MGVARDKGGGGRSEQASRPGEAYHFYLNGYHARSEEAQGLGSGHRDVDDAGLDAGTTVVDPEGN